MMEDKTLELQMIAALNTTKYCKENNYSEWKWIKDDQISIYTDIAQSYFNTQMINFTSYGR